LSAIIIIFWKFPFANKRTSIFMAFVMFAAFVLILEIILLPLQYYRSFVLEHRFGLSNQALSAWFSDIFKEKAIALVINSFVMTVIYGLIIYVPKHWWIAAAAIFIIFIVAAIFIFPVLIDPLFYKFSTLDNKNLESRIIEMAEDAGIKIESILVADASRKTNRINAYFTGIGSTKRIVIYDNLINKNTEDEVLSVIAHEMGHWKYRHIFISIIIGSAGMALLLFILRIMQVNLQAAPCIKLVALMFFFFTLISYITMPLQNCISRQFEKQADKTAIELTGSPEVSISIFKKLAYANLSNVSLHQILKYIIYSHPPIIERIKSAEKLIKY
jgi:STE24 endopeptidase